MAASTVMLAGIVSLGLCAFAASDPTAAAEPVESEAQDCTIGGPTAVNHPSGPVIVDTGSFGNNKGAGCDGCAVAQYQFEVTWHTAGRADIWSAGGGWSGNVVAGDTEKFASTPAADSGDISCGGALIAIAWISIIGNSPKVKFTCSECQ
jgi:hypothetical protein